MLDTDGKIITTRQAQFIDKNISELIKDKSTINEILLGKKA
ncbi:hypothetical protein PL321_09545 [Caloramator sp. mosi_1]|nr:hypothetical protein [Caloramator sp. mosi_1]WDC85494.1 hypothetical protein PL321_09545 [Caloramator sp. mosi_1]